MTRDALRELLKVSGENLALVPNTERLREYLAHLVSDRYRELGDKFPNDPGVQLETAQVFRVIGGIGRITGQYDNSRASYEKAIERLTALRASHPARADYRRWLVETFTDRGELSHMNSKTRDAEKDFLTAIDHAEQLTALRGPPSDYQRAKAPALINLSEVLLLQNRQAEAFKAADQAVELLKSLTDSVGESAPQARDRWLLSLALTDRGVAFKEAGDSVRSSRDFDDAAQISAPGGPGRRGL